MLSPDGSRLRITPFNLLFRHTSKKDGGETATQKWLLAGMEIDTDHSIKTDSPCRQIHLYRLVVIICIAGERLAILPEGTGSNMGPMMNNRPATTGAIRHTGFIDLA
jgi:hypothetical protein